MDHWVGKPEVRRAMESGAEKRAKENGGERKAMEYWGEMMVDWDAPKPVLGSEMPELGSEMVTCSTCSSFVRRKKRKLFPEPGEEVVEVVMEAEKMRNLSEAFLRYGPFQEMEPAEATKKQWEVLRRRRRIMMETKRCPACSRSLLCSTCSRSEKPTGAGPDEEDKAAGSKEKESSSEEGSELMAVANARSVKKSKRSRVEGNRSSSGLKKKKKKKKAKNEDKEGKKKANISSEIEGSGLKEVETEEGSGSKLAKMEVRESAGGNGKKTKMVTGKKTKMVTKRLDRMCIDIILRIGTRKPYTCDTINPMLECMFASDIRDYEVDCEFHEYLRRQSIIRGYAEYQMEVTDDEDE